MKGTWKKNPMGGGGGRTKTRFLWQLLITVPMWGVANFSCALCVDAFAFNCLLPVPRSPEKKKKGSGAWWQGDDRMDLSCREARAVRRPGLAWRKIRFGSVDSSEWKRGTN